MELTTIEHKINVWQQTLMAITPHTKIYNNIVEALSGCYIVIRRYDLEVLI